MHDVSLIALNRLLSKLDNTLGPNGDSRLHTSPYERNRVGTNLEHARTLLLTLERQSSSIRAQSQRDHVQSDLQKKREIIKSLNARLEDITQNADDDLDEDDDEDDREDILSTYAPAKKNVSAETDSSGLSQTPGENEPPPTANELRSRRTLQAGDNLTLASTTAREELFKARTKQEVPNSELEKTEALMSHNRTEQETLTSGLLGLAHALKESSIQFGASLEAEKDVLKRTEGGLDKSSQGMEAAEKKMGTLRKMSEGQGWWGRIKLYGFIFALWVACFLLVFIGPKLRF